MRELTLKEIDSVGGGPLPALVVVAGKAAVAGAAAGFFGAAGVDAYNWLKNKVEAC